MLQVVSIAAAIRSAIQSGDADTIRAALIEAIQQRISIMNSASSSDDAITDYIMKNYGAALGSLCIFAKLEQLIHNTAVIARKTKDDSTATRMRQHVR